MRNILYLISPLTLICLHPQILRSQYLYIHGSTDPWFFGSSYLWMLGSSYHYIHALTNPCIFTSTDSQICRSPHIHIFASTDLQISFSDPAPQCNVLNTTYTIGKYISDINVPNLHKIEALLSLINRNIQHKQTRDLKSTTTTDFLKPCNYFSLCPTFLQ